MHRRSLRVRLLAIVLAGIAIIAAVEALIGNWGLTNVRDVAINDSSGALKSQAADYLQTLAQGRADAIGQGLNTAQELASATRDYAGQLKASGSYEPPALNL